MKKIYVILAIVAILSISGCSYGKESQASQSLSAQIDNIEKTVSSTSTNEVIDVSPSISVDANTTLTSLQNYKATAYNNMMQEESLRQDILALSGSIKLHTHAPYKLNKTQANSIIELTTNLGKNADKLENTKGLVKNAVKKVKRHLNSGEKVNLTQAESSYISLNNAMNERYAYMSNIYANLEQIYRILDIENNTSISEAANSTQPETVQKEGKKGNIDTFSAPAQNYPTQPNQSTAPVDQVQMPPIINNQQYNPPYNYGYGIYNRGTFNPNRNTDTFYPHHRNIDTYRFNPNAYFYGNGAYNNGYYSNYYNQVPPIA